MAEEMSLDSDAILPLLLERLKRRAELRDARGLEERSVGSKLGTLGIGLAAGLGAGMTGGNAAQVADLAINNPNRSRLKALDGNDEIADSLMDLYKLAEMGKFRESAEKGRNDRQEKTISAADERARENRRAAKDALDKRIKAQKESAKVTLSENKKKEVRSKIDGIEKELGDLGYKFVDSKTSANMNARALNQLKAMRAGTNKIAVAWNSLLSGVGMESPEFATMNSKVKDLISNLILERSGKAASEPEMKRLEAILPKLMQRKSTFDAVADQAIKTADAIVAERQTNMRAVAAAQIPSVIKDEKQAQQARDAIMRGVDPYLVLKRARELYK